MESTRSAVLAALFVVVMAVAGCASADQSVSLKASAPTAGGIGREPGRALLLRAAATPARQRSGRFQMTMAVTGSAAMTSTVTGAFDEDHDAISFDATAGSGKASFAMGSVTVGGTSYLRLDPRLAQMLGVDTPWLAVDVKSAAAKLATVLPGAANGATDDPRSFIEVLKGVAGTVTTVGTEPVRGVTTTHLHATVVPSKALDGVPAEGRAKLAAIFGAALDQPIPVDAWVDEAGLLRRLRTEASPFEGVHATSTVELWDLGQAVTITAPPADQVTAAADLPGFGKLFGN